MLARLRTPLAAAAITAAMLAGCGGSATNGPSATVVAQQMVAAIRHASSVHVDATIFRDGETLVLDVSREALAARKALLSRARPAW